MLLTLTAFVALFVIVFLGLPIAFAMGLVGAVGYAIVINSKVAVAMIGQIAYDTVVTYEFSVLPLFYPVVTKLGYDPIWFGIVVVVAIEISLITPPIGLNVYMLKSIIPDVRATTIFRGVAPFIAADVVRLAVFVLAPAIVLFLPRLLT